MESKRENYSPLEKERTKLLELCDASIPKDVSEAIRIVMNSLPTDTSDKPEISYEGANDAI